MEYVGSVECIHILMVIFIRTLKAHILKHLSVGYIKIGSRQKKKKKTRGESLSKILKCRTVCLYWTSGQDGSIGICASPLHATAERITIRLKTNNIQSLQKIELYGSLTTKDLEMPHSSRW